MATDDAIFGTDFDKSWGVNANGDLKIVQGLSNAEQRVYNRTMTRLDELSEFGYVDYGNESWTVLGETDKNVVESKIKIFEESCLKKEPIVEDIINIDVSYDGRVAIIEVAVQYINETNTSNLVFGLEA